jgi:uncharacterized BrkB/YihY/UPF0761 family membrane protein
MNGAHLTYCRIMTIFSYAFGIAITFAIAIAIGNAWTHEHRRGVWTMRMIVMLVVVAGLLGIVVGWSLDAYLNFIAASATGRI